jgi:hypothetical protein
MSREAAKSWGITVAGIGAVIGVILSGMKLYQELGLPMLATQEHVEQKLAPVISNMQGVRVDVSDIALEQAYQRHGQIANQLAQWKLEMARATTDELKGLAQSRIDELNQQLDLIERRIQQLQRDAYGAH